MRICDFPVLTFDTYGTLIDWERGIWEAMQPLCSRLAEPPAREEALAAFAQAESACQEAAPGMLYSGILAATHRTLALNRGAEPDEAESVRFGRSVGDWPAFEDAADALAWLKRRHRLVTLTNCDRASYRGSAARLGNPWDAVLTSEEIGSYKPAAANFEYLVGRVRGGFRLRPRGHSARRAEPLPRPRARKEDGTGDRLDRPARRPRRRGDGAAAKEEVTPDFRFDKHGGTGGPCTGRSEAEPGSQDRWKNGD